MSMTPCAKLLKDLALRRSPQLEASFKRCGLLMSLTPRSSEMGTGALSILIISCFLKVHESYIFKLFFKLSKRN